MSTITTTHDWIADVVIEREADGYGSTFYGVFWQTEREPRFMFGGFPSGKAEAEAAAFALNRTGARP